MSDVKDLVALVDSKEHPKHMQIGKVIYHDWRESGEIGIEFPNGSFDKFDDDYITKNGSLGLKRFYRHLDGEGKNIDFNKSAGPVSFQKYFLEQGGNLKEMSKQYEVLFGEVLPKVNLSKTYAKLFFKNLFKKLSLKN